MRKLLLSAAAAAPLLLLGPGLAMADTTIGSTNNPVNTSTVNGGQPDNLIVGSGATVSVTGPVAVTMDSSNSVTNDGTISIQNVNNSTAVLLNGGNTGNFLNDGTITNSESYTRTDTNGDGVLDGDYAQGSGRYGVHLVGTGPTAQTSPPLIGTIELDAGSTITIQGNSSYGVALDAPLQGDLTQNGSIAVTGDNTVGIQVNGGISGKVFVGGAIAATGAAASGIVTTGPIGGSLSIYAPITSTGFSTTVRNADPTVNANLLPSDLQISNSAVVIGNDVTGGIFLGAPPTGTVGTDTTTDADQDGIVDSDETAGSITTYGTAPALLIGSATNNVHLGQYSASGLNAYGLILEGGITGTGVFDGFSGTAVQLGVPGGFSVNIDGGIHITSSASVAADGFQADATAIHVLSGVNTPILVNDGTIGAVSTTSLASQATAILLEAGANIGAITNSGAINGAVTGDIGNATAIADLSGNVTSVTNTGAITAAVTPTVDTDTATGKTIALDLSHNTTGVTLVQSAPATSTTSTTTPAAPKIVGDIYLGSGNDTVQFTAGTVTGTLDFGAGTGSFLIDDGASYAGALLATGGSGLAINVNNGTLENDSPATLNLTSLTVGSSGQLVFSVDPVNNRATTYLVSGQVNLATGAQLSVKLLSLLIPTSQTYTVVQATPGTLNIGSSSTLTANVPYMFVAQFTPDTANGTIDLEVQRRSAAAAGLNKAETAAWDPIYENLGLNSGIERAFLAQTDAAGYRSMVNQILPDYAGGVFRALSWANEQEGVAAGTAPIGQDQDGPTRAWTQEIVLDETKNTAQTEPYHILGVGVVAGLESVSPKGDTLGMKLGFVTANINDPDSPGDNLLGVSEINGGVYWRGNFGGFRADAQVGAGFMWANDRREFLYSDTIGVVHAVALSDWAGYTLSGRFGLSYTANMGAFFLEPEVHGDYFRLHEAGYSEHGGGTGFDMQVDPRTGELFSVTSSLIAGMNFGTGSFRWRPQIEGGYRTVISGDAGSTTTEFIGGVDPFTLAAESVRMNSAIGRIGLRIYSDYVDVLLDGGIAKSTDYTDLDIHLTARTVF